MQEGDSGPSQVAASASATSAFAVAVVSWLVVCLGAASWRLFSGALL